MSWKSRDPGQYADRDSGLHYNYFRSYLPILGRYTQGDPIGLGGGWHRFGYVFSNPLQHIDPAGLETVVVVNKNDTGYGSSWTGSHAGVRVGSGRDAVLYDPGGSYRNAEKGSGDALYGKDAGLAPYLDYQRRDGPDVEVIRFDTTPEQERQIKERIEQRGGGVPGLCARDVSDVLKGIGPFRDIGTSWTPKGLARELGRIKK